MDFTLGEDRQALVDVLGRFLRERYTIALRRSAAREAPGHDRGTWQQLAEIGAIGALFSPDHGGFGGTPFDVIAVFEALGSALVAEPVLPVLMAGTVLAKSRADMLEAIIAGEKIVAIALYEAQARYDWRTTATRATRSGDGWKIQGAKAVVLHAEAADAIIVSARDEDDALALFLIPADAPGLSLRGYATIDGQRAAELTLDGVTVPADARVGGEREAAEAVGIGTLAVCAEALGVMETLRAMTLDYLKTRVQFGAPIGRNQALQHRMAEVLIQIEQSRSAVINAAAALDTNPAAAERTLSAAKYTIGTAGTHVAEESIQMHGGIGMTLELDMTHYAKRAIMIDHQMGDADHHLDRYIALAAA